MRVVVAGASEEGVHLAGLLSAQGHEVAIIDRDGSAIAAAEETLDVMTVVGDAVRRSVLETAGTAGCRGFVALTSSDSDNMLAAALARSLGARVAVARVDAPEFYVGDAAIESGLLGVDVTLCTTRLATSALVSLLMAATLPYVRSFASDSVRVALLSLRGTPLAGKAAAAIDVGNGIRVAAVLRDGFLRRPVDLGALEAEDQLLVAGRTSGVLEMWSRLGGQGGRRRAVVIGGGDVGSQLASRLGRHLPRVEVVEKDRARAERIAAAYDRVTVLQGDARSAAFLRDQSVGDAGYLLAVTGDDEVNLLVSLLGHRLGAANTFTLLHRPGYAELYAELGVRGSIGTYDLVVDAALDAIAGRGLVRKDGLTGTGYAVVEWRMPPSLKGAAPRLSELGLPDGAILLAVSRAGAIAGLAPTLALEGGDTLLVAAPVQGVGSLDRALGRFDRGRAG